MTQETKLYLQEHEMPQNCMECPLKDGETDFPNIYCNVTMEPINGNEDIVENRHSTCPLRALK